MADRRERMVKELYNATASIEKPEITPVLRGSYLMQGPVDEADHDIGKNMVSSQPKTEFGNRSMSKKVHMRGECGTCNMCSAPCSSCLHLNRALMESKSEEFSDESCRINVASQYSVNERSLKSRVSDSLQHTNSETSNLQSINSSHGSFSENADSKVTLRSSIISDASEDVEMLPKLASGETMAEDQLSSKPQCGLDKRTFSNKYDKVKEEEDHDDNISCIRPNDANVEASDHSGNISKIPSISSLDPEGSRKTAQFNELGTSETPSKEADASGRSPNVQSAKPLPCSTVFTVLEENPSSVVQDKGLACSTDVNSSLTKVVASDIVSGHKFVSCKGSHIGGGSEVSMRNYTKSEAETDKYSGDQTDEALKSSDQVKNEFVESPNMQEHPLQSVSGDESDESDIVEQDVKVCDICGDAGREDLLAICSRCSDGAEHTYCMREMLLKVPEGDWLCEECKFAEEFEKQKQGSEVEGKGTINARSSTHVPGKRLAENIEVASAKREKLESGSESPHPSSPSKIVTGSPRPSSPSKIVTGSPRPSSPSKIVTGSPRPSSPSKVVMGSPRPSSPSKMAAPSRDSSFKSLDKVKVKSGQHTDILETARFPTTGQRLQTPKGALLKSNSFSTLNSKPKVKLVDDVVPQKQKGAREYASVDTKEGPTRTLMKSMSFKSANSGRTNATESKVKMLSSKFTHVQDLKGLKQPKERGICERKILPKLDRPPVSSTTPSSTIPTPKVSQKLTSRGETGLPSSGNNNRELKVAQSDGKTSLSKVSSGLGRKGVEVPVSSVGALSTSGMCSSAEQKLNQVGSKDEPLSSYSLNAERPGSNADGDAFPMTNHNEKIRESSGSRPRPIAASAPKNVSCQKCKDSGHATEFCTNGTPLAPGTDISTTKSSREEMHEGNKLKAAINAALRRRPEIYRKKRELDQPDELSTSSTDMNCEVTPQDQFLAANKSKNIIPSEGNCERQAIRENPGLDSYKHTAVSNSKQNLLPADVSSPKVMDIDSTVASAGKPTVTEFPVQAVTSSGLLKTSAIPEYDFIWQGVFEVHKGGRLQDICAGIQAHISTCASPKVLEVVNRFPQKVSLHEVSRLSTWPSQFYENGAKEDNIALYFFAKDVESYERNYKSLLDGMIKKDLALKGNLDGVELLIFPSNHLPEKSQRWNMLFFLWGVFRGKRENCMGKDIPPAIMTLSENLSKDIPPAVVTLSENLDKDIPPAVVTVSENLGKDIPPAVVTLSENLGKDIPPAVVTLSENLGKDIPPAVMTLSENLCSPRPMDEDLPACDRSCSMVLAPSATNQVHVTVSGAGDDNTTSLKQISLGYQGDLDRQDGRLDSKSLSKTGMATEPLNLEVRHSNSSPEEPSLPVILGAELKAFPQATVKSGSSNVDKAQVHWSSPSNADKAQVHWSTSSDGEDKLLKILPVGNKEIGILGSGGEDKSQDRMNGVGDQVKHERELLEDAAHVDREWAVLDREVSNRRKRPYLDLSEPAPEASSDTTEEMDWDETDGRSVDGESSSKRLKSGFSIISGYSNSGGGNSGNDNFASQVIDPGRISCIEEKKWEEACDEKVIREDLGSSSERYFFPVDSQRGKEFIFGEFSAPWKKVSSDCEPKLHDEVPNLELALGAERKPASKGTTLPFFAGTVGGKKSNQAKPPDKVKEDEEDGFSASLSLSLSFPFPDKEQTVKPASKTERLLPERRSLNNSLFLFRGLRDQ